MKEFKSIITHPEGQNLFPGQITTIEGYPHGTSITMQNTKPQIALTPYGASYMMPNMDYKFAGNTVVELPMAQMGGQDQQQQLMQMIQIYAQMKGMKPEELIQKLQSLPKEQQEQAVQSIAQEVQQAMAQQQESQMAQQEQEGMMGQQQEMGMARHGGLHKYQNDGEVSKETAWDNNGKIEYYKTVNTETGPRVYKGTSPDLSTAMKIANFKIRTTPGDSTQWGTLDPKVFEKLKQQDGGQPCFDCFDHYNPSPQAQDLNWFYKKQGGPFSAANTYPEDWASYHGNQYQKKGQTGNKSFIDKATSFLDNAEEESLKLVPSLLFDGNAPKKDIDWSSIGNSIGRNLNTFMKTSPLGMLFSTPVTVSNPSEEYGPQVEQHLKEGGNTVLQSDPNAQTYLPNDRPHETRPNFMFETGGQSNIEDIYRIMQKGGIDYNPSKKKGGKFNHLDEFKKYLEKGGGLKKYQYENSITEEEVRKYRPGIGWKSPQSSSEYCVDGDCRSLQGYYGTDKTEDEWWDYRTDYVNQITPNYNNWDKTLGFRPIGAVPDAFVRAGMIAHTDLVENNLAKQLQQAQASGDTKLAADIQQKLMQIQHDADHAAGYMSGIYSELKPRKNDPYDYFTNPENQPSARYDSAWTGYKGTMAKNINPPDQKIYQYNNDPAAVASYEQYKKEIENKKNAVNSSAATPVADEDLQFMTPKPAQPIVSTDNEIDLPKRSTSVPFDNQIPLSLQDKDYMMANSGQYFNTPGNVPYNQTIIAGNNMTGVDSPRVGFRDPNTDRYTYEETGPDATDIYSVTDNKTGKVSSVGYGTNGSNKILGAIESINPWYKFGVNDDPTYDYSKIAGNPLPTPAAAPGSSTSTSTTDYSKYVPVPSNYRDQTPSGDNEFDWNKYGRGWYSKKAQRDFDAGMGKGWGTEYQKPMSAADQLKGQEKQMKKYLRKSMRRGLDLNPLVDSLNMGAAMTGNKGLFGALAAVGNLGRTVSDVSSGWLNPGRLFKDGGELDKYQAWMSQPGSSFQHSDTPLTTFVLPESMRYNAAYNSYLNSHPVAMTTEESFLQSNTTTNPQGYEYSFMPGSTSDPAYAKFSDNGAFNEPIYNQNVPTKKKKDKGWKFNFQRAEKNVAGLGQIADYFHNYKVRNSDDADTERRNMFTSEFMPVFSGKFGGEKYFGGGQYGDWSTNATQGTSFRPDEMVYAQKMGRPYRDVNVYDYAEYSLKKGGSILDKYNEDDEYDLTEEEIRQIVAAGGTIEYL